MPLPLYALTFYIVGYRSFFVQTYVCIFYMIGKAHASMHRHTHTHTCAYSFAPTRVRFVVVSSGGRPSSAEGLTFTSVRVGRRRHLVARDRQRAVGWPTWALDRDRRRRRHLRPRRPQRRRQPLQRHVGGRQRRCGPDSRRGTRGVLKGISRGI